MKSRAIHILIVTAIAIAAWSSREKAQRESVEESVLIAARDLLSEIEGYEKDQDRIESILPPAHARAFGFAYRMGTSGGRFSKDRPGEFDEDQYNKWLFISLGQEIRKAIDNASKVKEIEEFRDLHKRLETLRKDKGIKGLNIL